MSSPRLPGQDPSARARRARALAALLLALGIATPLACAKGVDGILEDEKNEGGAGVGGAGGATDTGPGSGPSVGNGSPDGPTVASTAGVGGATSSTNSVAASSSPAAQSVAASSTQAAASSAQAVAVVSSSSGGTSTCCIPFSGVGCDDPLVESCVCFFDPVCCNDIWDDICVDDVNFYGCGAC